MSIPLIDDLVDELEATVGTSREIAHEALVHLNHRGSLRTPGREVKSDQLAKGDRYRVEYDYVHHNRLEVITDGEAPRKKLVRRHTVEQIRGEGSPEPAFFSGDSVQNTRYFLLERAGSALPTAPGTVATFRGRQHGLRRQLSLGNDGAWRGIDVCLAADILAEDYELVEVLA